MKYKFLIIFLFISSISYAQSNIPFDYLGTLAISDTILLSYELKFDVINNEIIGYSYTDIGGADETKSLLRGSYNENSEVFEFRESEILYTKSMFNEGDFCFVSGIGKMNFKKTISRIEGDFIGNLPDGEECARGQFNLMSLVSVKKKFEDLNKKVRKSKFVKKEKKKEFFEVDILGDMKTSVLKAGENMSVFCKSNVIKIEIWDNQIEDGDIITVIFNGEEILSSYKIKNEKKILMIKLPNQKNTLEFIANGVGLSGDNTATINVMEKDKTTNVSTRLALNERTKIILIQN